MMEIGGKRERRQTSQGVTKVEQWKAFFVFSLVQALKDNHVLVQIADSAVALDIEPWGALVLLPLLETLSVAPVVEARDHKAFASKVGKELVVPVDVLAQSYITSLTSGRQTVKGQDASTGRLLRNPSLIIDWKPVSVS